MYLGLVDEILDVFSVAAEDKDHMKYVSWLDMFYAGIKGLEMYQPKHGKWGQAHSQARFVILRVALEEGDGVVNVVETKGEDGLPDLLLTVDRSKVNTSGRKAIGSFLQKLQVYRAMGDSEAGRAMFEKYSEVHMEGTHPFGKWHEIVVRKRKPRMVLIMPNTRIVGEEVELISYPETAESMVTSWVDRFSPQSHEFIEESLTAFSSSWCK